MHTVRYVLHCQQGTNARRTKGIMVLGAAVSKSLQVLNTFSVRSVVRPQSNLYLLDPYKRRFVGLRLRQRLRAIKRSARLVLSTGLPQRPCQI